MKDIPLQGTVFSTLDALDRLNMAAFLINAKGLVISANRAALGLFQYSTEETSGRDITEVIFADGGRGTLFPSSKARRDNATEMSGFEGLCRKKDGSVFEAEVTLIPREGSSQRLVVIADFSHRKGLEGTAAQRTKELSLFDAFARVINSHDDMEKITQASTDMLLPVMGADAAWLYLMDEPSGRLRLEAVSGGGEGLTDMQRGLKPYERLSAEVCASGKPLLVEDASGDARLSEARADTLGVRSIASVPVSYRGVVRGVLSAASRKAANFTSMDAQMLSILGSQLGAALENAMLIRQLGEKMRQIKLINELSGTINSSLSIGTLFRMMSSEIRQSIDYDRASLLLYDEQNGNLVIFALNTEMKTVLPKGVRAPIEGTSAGWALRNNHPWVNYDLRAEMKFPLDRKLLLEGIRSTISIPLSEDKKLGVFNLDSTRPAAYSMKDLQVLLPVSKHISIALENALLFEEISREKKEWERTFDAITDMVWIEDVHQRIIRVNKALLSRTGLSVMEAEGRHCCEILGKIGIADTECLCTDTVVTGKPSSRELKGSGGGIFHFWAYPLMDDEDRLYAIVHYIKDVTSQKRLEQQLVRADKLASLGTLMAGIAHEINNPLGIIAGYSEALRDRARDAALLGMTEFEDFPEYLDTIHKEIFRCKEILGSLLEFSRPHKGKARQLDINELIKEVILLVNHRAKRQQHDIEFMLDRDLPKIVAEPGGLRQLFMNIIINSIYFTPGGGKIVIKTERDRTARRDGEMLMVSISDTGEGIPPDVIDKVFDPFFSTKPVGEGTGLGLAICHKIAREHGGLIDVRSAPGEGATFVVKLPAKKAHE